MPVHDLEQSAEPQPIAEPVSASTLGTLWSAYFQQGYDSGYRAAVKDVLRSLIPISEEFITLKPAAAPEVQRVLYAFEEFLDQRIARFTPDEGYVEDGMGI